MLKKLGGAGMTQHRKRRRVDSMQAGEDLAALARQAGPRTGQGLRPGDAAAERFAFDETHQKTVTEPVLRLQDVRHRRHRNAGLARGADERRFGLQADGRLGNADAPWRTAQDERGLDAVAEKGEAPDFLGGSGGHPGHAADPRRAESVTRQSTEPVLDVVRRHLSPPTLILRKPRPADRGRHRHLGSGGEQRPDRGERFGVCLVVGEDAGEGALSIEPVDRRRVVHGVAAPR